MYFSFILYRAWKIHILESEAVVLRATSFNESPAPECGPCLWSRKRAVMLWNVCLCVFLHLCVYLCTSIYGCICVSCVSDRDLSLLSPFPHLSLSGCWITPKRVILGSPAIAHGSQRFLAHHNHETHRGRKTVSFNSVHHHEATN